MVGEDQGTRGEEFRMNNDCSVALQSGIDHATDDTKDEPRFAALSSRALDPRP